MRVLNSCRVRAEERGRMPRMTNFPFSGPLVHFMALAVGKMFSTLRMKSAAGRVDSSH